jgi:hypothetical protein
MAEMMNVGRSAVQRAHSVFASVEARNVSVSAAAEVARLLKEIQAEIVDEGPKVVRARSASRPLADGE